MKSSHENVVQAMVCVMAVKIQCNSPIGERRSFSRNLQDHVGGDIIGQLVIHDEESEGNSDGGRETGDKNIGSSGDEGRCSFAVQVKV